MKKLVTFTFCSIIFMLAMIAMPGDKKEVAVDADVVVTRESVIQSFVTDNPQYFELDSSTLEIEELMDYKDWADGKRYLVFLKGNTKGNYWTLYLKGNEVVGVRYGEGETQIKLL